MFTPILSQALGHNHHLTARARLIHQGHLPVVHLRLPPTIARARRPSPSQLNSHPLNFDQLTIQHLEIMDTCKEVILACDGMIGGALLAYNVTRAVHQIPPRFVGQLSTAPLMCPLTPGAHLVRPMTILSTPFPTNAYRLPCHHPFGCPPRPPLHPRLPCTTPCTSFLIWHRLPCQIPASRLNLHMAIHPHRPVPQLIRNLFYSQTSFPRTCLAVMGRHPTLQVPSPHPDCPGLQI